MDSAGKLTIKADTLASEGAQVNSAGQLSVTANQVDNRAASDTTRSSHQQSNWSADVGVNVEYKDIARPIAGVVKDVVDGKVTVKDALDGKLPLKDVKDVLDGKTSLTDALGKLGTPNLGVDLAVGHASEQRSEQTGTAVVGQFNGQGVELNVAGAVKDQGTQYNANGGVLSVKAGSLQAEAASNTHSRTEQQVTADVSARVYTKTGEDLNVTANGSGEQVPGRRQIHCRGGQLHRQPRLEHPGRWRCPLRRQPYRRWPGRRGRHHRWQAGPGPGQQP